MIDYIIRRLLYALPLLLGINLLRIWPACISAKSM